MDVSWGIMAERFLDQFEFKRCKPSFEKRMLQMVFHKYLDTVTSVCSNLEVLDRVFLYTCSNVRLEPWLQVSTWIWGLMFVWQAACVDSQWRDLLLCLPAPPVRGKEERMGRSEHGCMTPQPRPWSLALELDNAWRVGGNLHREVGRGSERNYLGSSLGLGDPPERWEKYRD